MNNYSEYFTFVFLGIPSWKLATMVLLPLFLYAVRIIVLWICSKIKKAQIHFGEKSFFQFFLDQKIEKPLSWFFVSSLAFVIIEYLSLPENLAKYVILIIKLFLTFNVIRICYMAAEAFGHSMEEWAIHTQNQLDDQLAPFAARTLKVLVIIIGVLIGLQNFGINVTALLAGLGIGGVALAFAAQDTVANVFGTITIIFDRPFKLGDLIKVGDTEGNVVEVGFRSTRIRTFYNSIVTIPNSIVAKERIDNLTERDGWIRFRHMIGFTYAATTEQLNSFCENLQYQIRQSKGVDPERINVTLNAFGDSSLNVLVIFHYTLEPDESDFKKIESFLHLISQLAQQNNLEFAFPTRTIQMTGISLEKPKLLEN
jgi:MscS family membrane protein